MRIPKFTISVAVHNLWEMTKRCISSIFAHSSDFELFVTNNASTDETARYLASVETGPEGDPYVGIITNNENLGFNAAHNRAFTMAKGEFFVVINNDLEVVPGWLSAMESEFRKNGNLSVCGVRGGCTSLNQEGMGYPSPSLEYVEGSCLMVKRQEIQEEKLGLFSPEFKFAYNEDSDLSLRMRERGKDIAIADVHIVHLGSKTSSLVRHTVDLAGYEARNRMVFKEKWKRYLAERGFTRNILVLRAGATGDAFMVTPILRSLKKKWPCARITMVTAYPDAFARNPHLFRLDAQETQPRSMYDMVFDLNLAYERSPQKHAVQAYADACGIAVDSYIPEIFPTQDDERFALYTLPKGRKIAVLNPGPTNWVGRNYSIENWCKVTQGLKDRGYFTVEIGFNHPHNALPCDLDLRGRTTVHQVYSILKSASVYVGIDSFPMHLAVAANTPIAAIFGCVSPEYRLPPGIPYMRGVMAKNVGCLGCHHYLPGPRITTSCYRGEVMCMTRLSPEHVLLEADEAVRQKS